MRAGRVLGWVGAGVLAAAAVAAGAWAAYGPLPSGPREAVYVIPRGTAARQALGEAPEVLPARIRMTIGVRDVLVLRNEDEAPATFGPVRLEPGQTLRLPLRRPGTLELACSAHPAGRVSVVVEPAPPPGARRLLWRLER